MFYITGDTHGDFKQVAQFCFEKPTSKDDVMIILGDAGINYYGQDDKDFKTALSELPITLFCIHGNHEMRPQSISTYRTIEFYGGSAFMEPAYPNLVFAKDGETYLFNKQVLVIGGAYSVDKFQRIITGHRWFPDEQPDNIIKQTVEQKLVQLNNKIEVVLTHTCPFSVMPTEAFIPGLKPELVDNSTEKWLEQIKQKLEFNDWYCGHFHINKDLDKFHFLFDKIEEF